jgi:polar amino acid transport system substrate-binding protein
VTEYSPPFTDINSDQKEGYATIPMRAIVGEAGYAPNITTLSWKAALDIVQSKPSVLIYPLARTPERESQFTWIGRLGRLRYFVYHLRSRHLPTPSGLEALKQYRIAVIRRDIRENYMLAHGFQPGSNAGLIDVSDNIEAFQLLRVGRVDLGIFSPPSIAQLCVNQQVDCSEFDIVMPLDLSSDLYLAGNRQMPAEQAHRLQAAYKRLAANGTLRRITPAPFYGAD